MLDQMVLEYYCRTRVEEYERQAEQLYRARSVDRARKCDLHPQATVSTQTGGRSGLHAAGSGLSPGSAYH
jgi:hypothetical protein